jgi:hypothetical protein
MNGWAPKDIKNSNSILSANLSAVQMGNTFSLSAGGASRALLVAIKCSSIAGTVTFQLQNSLGADWVNVSGKTATGTNGWAYIKLHAGVVADAALLPLLDIGRIVVTTDGSGAGTIEELKVLQEL